MTSDEATDTGAKVTRPSSFHGGFGIKTRLLNPIDVFWDLRLGVSTFGYKPALGKSDAPDFRGYFTPTPYRKLFKILRRMNINSQDTFLDLGCGLGRAVFAASWLGAQQSVGVEIDEELTAGAMATWQSSHLIDRNIKFICSPAETFEPLDVTIIYMFHPFGPGTMEKVIHKLEQELQARPRRLCIAYENPVYAEVIDAANSFRRLDEWPEQKASGSHYPVVFWETTSY